MEDLPLLISMLVSFGGGILSFHTVAGPSKAVEACCDEVCDPWRVRLPVHQDLGQCSYHRVREQEDLLGFLLACLSTKLVSFDFHRKDARSRWRLMKQAQV